MSSIFINPGMTGSRGHTGTVCSYSRFSRILRKTEKRFDNTYDRQRPLSIIFEAK